MNPIFQKSSPRSDSEDHYVQQCLEIIKKGNANSKILSRIARALEEKEVVEEW